MTTAPERRPARTRMGLELAQTLFRLDPQGPAFPTNVFKGETGRSGLLSRFDNTRRKAGEPCGSWNRGNRSYYVKYDGRGYRADEIVEMLREHGDPDEPPVTELDLAPSRVRRSVAFKRGYTALRALDAIDAGLVVQVVHDYKEFFAHRMERAAAKAAGDESIPSPEVQISMKHLLDRVPQLLDALGPMVERMKPHLLPGAVAATNEENQADDA